MLCLIRRLLLCLLVGVTTFAAVGWLLSPRPTWAASLGLAEGGLWFPERFEGPHCPEEPVWILTILGQRIVECRDPSTGQLLRRLEGLDGYVAAVRPPGELVIVAHKPRPGARTTFRILDPSEQSRDASWTIEGYWTPTADGRYAWQARVEMDGLSFSVIDIRSGEVVRRRTFPGYRRAEPEDFAVSGDAGLVAIGERVRQDVQPPLAIDVWDVETGERRWRVLPPDDRRGKGEDAGSPRFTDGGRRLNFTWDDGLVPSRWEFDLGTGVNRKFPFPTPVPLPVVDPTGGASEPRFRWNGSIWQATTQRPDAVWYCIDEVGALTHWKTVPSAVGSIQSPWADHLFAQVPGRPALIAAITAPPLSESIPAPLRRLIPGAWRTTPAVKYLWHDWRAERWLNVGCPSNVTDIEVRGDALLALMSDDGEPSYLQAWPLPPRDPKWPAGGAAIAATVGTWLLCRQRARRKQAGAA